TQVPGTSDTYTIVVSNGGPSDAVGASVADSFPGSFGSVSWTASGTSGTSFTASGSGNIAATVSIPAGGSITYTASGTVSSAATGTLSNTASASVAAATTTDPLPGNNSATDSDTLTPQADLAVTKTDGKTTQVPGTSDTYTIVVSNGGPSDAVGASVADSFPGSFGSVSWTASGTS